MKYESYLPHLRWLLLQFSSISASSKPRISLTRKDFGIAHGQLSSDLSLQNLELSQN